MNPSADIIDIEVLLSAVAVACGFWIAATNRRRTFSIAGLIIAVAGILAIVYLAITPARNLLPLGMILGPAAITMIASNKAGDIGVEGNDLVSGGSKYHFFLGAENFFHMTDIKACTKALLAEYFVIKERQIKEALIRKLGSVDAERILKEIRDSFEQKRK